MEAAYPPLLPLTTLQRAYECVSRGICHPLNTLVAGWVYDLVDACRRHRDIFVVLRRNYPTQYTVIQLPQRCHEDFVHFTYTGNTPVSGKRVFLVDGGGFHQSLIE